MCLVGVWVAQVSVYWILFCFGLCECWQAVMDVDNSEVPW
jgi:hypothetical protein